MTWAEEVGALAQKEGLCTPFLGMLGPGHLGRAGDFCWFFQNLGEARAHSILAASACLAHAPRSVHFLGSWQVWWDPGHLCDFSPPVLCPAPQPQPSTICYFLLYPKNYKQKSFPQGNSNKGQWGHKGRKKNSLLLQALGRQRPWIRQRDGQKNLQGDLDTEAGEPASGACVSLVVACEAAAQRSHSCGGG